MNLNPSEVRAAYYAVTKVRREAALSNKPVPPALAALCERLDVAVRCGLTPTRQAIGCRTEQLESWIGTRLAAQMLGWKIRRVERRATDFDGRKAGHRWIFPERAIKDYCEQMAQKENP